ncbi:hypothetical protein FHR22_004070 [Sphingopyxis panaciterrae]|uniref:tail fiber domain-containing protein n=1 Tax=Sphingopyxis panaciterrae TaxID=363841 RepID=UPI00141FB73C|nr:hypothetical protein [Sphingopyxis panaciterrae]NIJ39323.1 hypothetical protein [Sphingopyxis panaciterrae]
MPTPFFADLVRELCQEGGTGPLTPTGAVPGHRRFAGVVPVDTSFHYAIAGIAHPDQWEVGLGRIDGEGRLIRDSVAASSYAGARVDFAIGLKTVALTVGAGWFGAADAAAAAVAGDIAGLDAALAAKQPLSTGHADAATGTSEDKLTVRRGADWVNIPLSTLAYRDAAGRHALSGVLGIQNGTAAAPSVAFSSDLDTGIFRAAENAVGFAAGGAESARWHSGGLSVGGTAPLAGERLGLFTTIDGGVSFLSRLNDGTNNPHLMVRHVAASNLSRIDVNAASGVAQISLAIKNVDALTVDNSRNTALSGLLTIPVGSAAAPSLRFAGNSGTGVRGGAFLTLITGGADRLVVQGDGRVNPGADNAQSLGISAMRWSVVYAGTGTINTSDARDKLWRGAPAAAELRAARRIAAELGFYQWLARIDEAGANEARFHFGVRAQVVWEIMADEGLVDPLQADGTPGETRYAFLCWDAWPAEVEDILQPFEVAAVVDEASGAEIEPARTEMRPTGETRTVRAAGSRFGIRPDQLALFLIAAQEERLAALEAAA